MYTQHSPGRMHHAYIVVVFEAGCIVGSVFMLLHPFVYMYVLIVRCAALMLSSDACTNTIQYNTTTNTNTTSNVSTIMTRRTALCYIYVMPVTVTVTDHYVISLRARAHARAHA